MPLTFVQFATQGATSAVFSSGNTAGNLLVAAAIAIGFNEEAVGNGAYQPPLTLTDSAGNVYNFAYCEFGQVNNGGVQSIIYYCNDCVVSSSNTLELPAIPGWSSASSTQIMVAEYSGSSSSLVCEGGQFNNPTGGTGPSAVVPCTANDLIVGLSYNNGNAQTQAGSPAMTMRNSGSSAVYLFEDAIATGSTFDVTAAIGGSGGTFLIGVAFNASPSAPSTFRFEQTSTILEGTGAGAHVTFAQANKVNDTLIAMLEGYNYTTEPTPPSTVTDPAGNIYTLAYFATTTADLYNQWIAIYYCAQCVAAIAGNQFVLPAAFTASGSGTALNAIVAEYAGTTAATAPDGSGANSVVSSSGNPSLTLSGIHSGDLVIAVIFYTSGFGNGNSNMSTRFTSGTYELLDGMATSSSMTITGTNVAARDAITFAIAFGLSPLTITTTSPLPVGIVGTPYTDTLTAIGGTETGYTWSVTAGESELTAIGLSLSSAGVLSGATPVVGTASFTVQVEDSGSNIITKPLQVTINPLLSITTTSPLTDGYGDEIYIDTLEATGGTGTGYIWSVTAGASELTAIGLSLSSIGVLSGSTPSLGTATFTAKVTDSGDNTATQPLTVTIVKPLTITTTSPLPNSYGSGAYSAQLQASGGTQTGYTWSVTAGASQLTAIRLSLSSSGLLSGSSPTPGIATFTAQVEDSGSNIASASFTVTIYSYISGAFNMSLKSGPKYVFECLPEGRKIAQIKINCSLMPFMVGMFNYDELSDNISNPNTIAGYVMYEFDLAQFKAGIGLSQVRSLIAISRPLFLADDYVNGPGVALPSLLTNETTGQSVILGSAAIALNKSAAVESLVIPFVGDCTSTCMIRFLSPQQSSVTIGRFNLLFCNWDVQGSLITAGAF